MSSKRCPVCAAEMKFVFQSTALNKYAFDLMVCHNCEFLQIDDPYWLSEAYSNEIPDCDTGLVARNISLSSRLNPIYFYLFNKEGVHLDAAGGTGIFVRLMRDFGYDFFWSDAYCKNVHARGFEYVKGVACNSLTAFEVLEHLPDPYEFIAGLLCETGAEVFFFSTELYDGDVPNANDWWYYSFESGQHISFYKEKTLRVLSSRLGLDFCKHEGLYVFAKQKYIEKIKRFDSSSFVRSMSNKARGYFLESRTLSDHELILKKRSL